MVLFFRFLLFAETEDSFAVGLFLDEVLELVFALLKKVLALGKRILYLRMVYELVGLVAQLGSFLFQVFSIHSLKSKLTKSNNSKNQIKPTGKNTNAVQAVLTIEQKTVSRVQLVWPYMTHCFCTDLIAGIVM